MIVYEVRLFINNEIDLAFHTWLKKHIAEMLQLPGFIKAMILKPDQESPNQKKLTIHYHLENRQALANYMATYAGKMREEGLRLFQDQFVAERQIYEIEMSLSR